MPATLGNRSSIAAISAKHTFQRRASPFTGDNLDLARHTLACRALRGDRHQADDGRVDGPHPLACSGHVSLSLRMAGG
ncbi:hypothetical protein J4558_09125 [Leptolyngbya sp. 15MV]|nr:hypothetical protein J4558_09125 [Leptolyngbya sp. 15MV]